MIRRVVGALVVVAAVSAAPAAAGPVATDLVEHVDGDAWLIARIEPEQVATLVAIARLVRIDVSAWWSAAPLLSSRHPAFDPGLAASWRTLAVAPDAPILYQIRAAERVGARTGTRSRLVLAIGNAEQSRLGITRLWQLTAISMSASQRTAIAAELNIPARDVSKAIQRLRAARIFGVRRADDGWVLARIAGPDVAVIDHIAFSTRRLSWRAQGDLLLSLAQRRPDAFAGATKRPAVRLLDRPGVALWLQASALAEAGPEIRSHWTHCAAVRQIAAAGTFESFGMRARIGRDAVAATLEWAVRPDSGLDRALATVDNQLAPPRGETLSVSILTAAPARLRALPRPDTFPRRWEGIGQLARDCGSTGGLAMLVFGWPQALGLYLDEVVALDPSAEKAVAGLRNVVVAADKLSWDPEQIVGLVELSIDDAGRREVYRYLDAVFGGRTRRASPLAHLRWHGSLLKPYAWQRGGRSTIGAGIGPADVDVRIGARAATARRSVPVAEVGVQVERALGDLGAGQIAKLVANRFGNWLDARLVLGNGALSAEISTSAR